MVSERFEIPRLGTVDRAATVARHRVRLGSIDPLAPLQVGNGEFAIAVDATGLQTFPGAYPVEGGGSLLGTHSSWGWHSSPAPRPYSLAETTRVYRTPRGPVEYVDLSSDVHDADDQTDAERWLRGNPHRLHLGLVGLWVGPAEPIVAELGAVEQELDPSTGIIDSRFALAGRPYRVRTAAHPRRDAVAVQVEGPASGPVGVRLRFPYGSDAWGNAADWSSPAAHQTLVVEVEGGWRLERTLDDTSYGVTVRGPGLTLQRHSAHDLVFVTRGRAAAVVEFERAALAAPLASPLSVDEVLAASRDHWQEFWATGACVDLAGSAYPLAPELERRVVLSQYLTAVNCAGSLPPAETGLMLNSWRGKFHLEMHWFHGLHFAAWGRPRLLERSLAWYESILPLARQTAWRQGNAGARWPKQVGPDGRETPSSIGPFLVWQQPHPIYLAEMSYRADPSQERLARHAELVYETAEFMASFPVSASGAASSAASGGAGGFRLGPPIVPSQESYAATRATASDPTFELVYWSWALHAACRWWERLGRSAPTAWQSVADGMARPHVIDGTYAALATPPYLTRDDHPGMLGALGMVPATDLIDPAVMSRTLDDVMGEWDWDSTWGWDYPLAAMTAARLGRPDAAVATLLLDRQKNRYLVNGHNRQTARLPIYLPGNGGLLTAVALMAGGWDGSPRAAPGFGPGWNVAHEGLIRLP